MLEVPGEQVQSFDSNPGLSGIQTHVLSTTLCWVSVISELMNGLRFSSLEDFWVRATRVVICTKSVPTWASLPDLGFFDLREERLYRIPWNCTQKLCVGAWRFVLARMSLAFIRFSKGSMTQKRLITTALSIIWSDSLLSQMRKWTSWILFSTSSFCCLFWSYNSTTYAVLLQAASATSLVLWKHPSEAKWQDEWPALHFS